MVITRILVKQNWQGLIFEPLKSFANDIKQLESEKKMVPESSGISQLDPFLGINFVGTRNQIQRAFKVMKYDKIKSFLQENGADRVL